MDLRYPIGIFEKPANVTAADRANWIADLESLPSTVRMHVERLGPGGLDTPYRPGGWTARVVVHHLADSHMNSFVRFRLALTEDRPTIKPYDEAAWALLADSQTMDPAHSMAILDGLHARWVVMMRSLSEDDYKRAFLHPELGEVGLDHALALYSWHCRHHAGHLGLIAA
ncbi:MAG: YfiT family bacillithiol transferase [Acidobacteriota bacterium]